MADPEEFAPDSMRTKTIGVALRDDPPVLRVGVPVTVDFDYSRSTAQLPLRVTVQSGTSKESASEQVFSRVRPGEFTFTPVEGGPHYIRIGELFHQREFGSLHLTIDGPRQQGTL